jgi:hypothetical protein
MTDLGIPAFHSSNFLTEKMLLKVMYSTLVQGELIPEHSITNSKRISRFMVHNSIYNKPTQDSKSFSWNGGTYIVYPEAEMSYKLVDAVEKVNEMKLVKLPNAEVLKKLHDVAIKNSVSKAKGNGKYTVADLLNFINSIGAVLKEDDSLKEDASAFLGTWLTPELGILEQAIKPAMAKIQELEKTDKVKAKKALEDLKAMDLIATINPQIQDETKKFKPFTEDLEARYTETVNKFTESEKTYRENQEEIDAQSEVLMSAINVLGGQ